MTRSRTGQRGVSQRMGVVDQVVLALHARNRLATALGFVAGGVVPVATYVEAHHDMDASSALYSQITTYLVLGGLVFSAKTVFSWARRAFADGWKAAGFVVLLEGVMITSQVPVLPLVLLTILVAVNGIATGCTLSVERAPTRGVDSHGRRGVVVPISNAENSRILASRGGRLVSATATPPTGKGTRALRGSQERFAFDAKPVGG